MAGAIVQSTFGESASGSTSFTLAFPVNNTAGNAIFAVANDEQNTSQTLTITDSNNTYGANLDTVNDAGTPSTNISNAVGNIAAGANSVKVTKTGGFSTVLALCIAEISGVTSSPIDGHHGNTQASPGAAANAIISGTATPTNTAFMAAYSVQTNSTGNGKPNAGTGFTSTAGTNITVTGQAWGATAPNARLEWEASFSGGSAHQATFTESTADDGTFNTLMVMFDESSAATFPVGQILL